MNLKIDRNQICPCGSGKKFKKCCGVKSSSAPARPDPISVNRLVAYAGDVGKRRHEFCENYKAFKKAKIFEIHETLSKDIASKDLKILCGPGCSHCCSQFVVASLQECEGIVHYLYRNQSILRNFLQTYPAWLKGVADSGRCYDTLVFLCEKINAGKATEPDFAQFNASCRTYLTLDNACPFLVEDSCSIYEVRPFVCANYFSVTPPELCRADHPDHKNAVHVKIKLLGQDMKYFLPTPKTRLVSPVPLLVYQLLKESYGAISKMTQNPELKNEVLRDPSFREALNRALADRSSRPEHPP